MPPTVSFQGSVKLIQSIEEFGRALDDFDSQEDFELWLHAQEGPALCMLRHAEAAWLMYLNHADDSGSTSIGNPQAEGTVQYRLSNGQVDEYPAAWCIDVETGYKALAYFFVNDGLRPNWIKWQES